MKIDHLAAQNYDSTPSDHINHLGKALVARDLVSLEQFSAVVQKLSGTPRLGFKHAISLVHNIPMYVLDRVDLEDVVLPLLPNALSIRLQAIAQKDRFTKNMHLDSYLKNVKAHVLQYETCTVESRRYGPDGGDSFQVDRFEVNEATVEVTLETIDGQVVPGKLHITHNSQTQQLTITQEDDDLKGTLYFGLKQAYMKDKT